MIVISSPFRLKLAVAALFLSVPLVAVEVIIATHSPWWNLPLREMGYWSIAYFLLCFPLGLWILGGRKWAYSVLRVLFIVWLLASATLAVKNRLPTLGFFALFLAMLGWIELNWLKQELGRSFLDPQMFWFQGLPRSIPGLKCRVEGPESKLEFDVSRMDQDGAFVCVPYQKQELLPSFRLLHKKRKIDLEFYFRENQLSCSAKPVTRISSGAAVGLQFISKNPDTRKDIGEFVEKLRGEGHL